MQRLRMVCIGSLNKGNSIYAGFDLLWMLNDDDRGLDQIAEVEEQEYEVQGWVEKLRGKGKRLDVQISAKEVTNDCRKGGQ